MKNKGALLNVTGKINKSLIAGLCAAVLFALFIAVFVLKNHEQVTSLYASIDNAEISEAIKGTETMSMIFGDMGAGEVMADDISRLDKASPWSEEANIKEMPVLRNDAFVDDKGFLAGMSLYLNEEQMTSIVQNTAKALRLEVTDLNVDKASDNIKTEDPDLEKIIENQIYSVGATCSDNSTITVYGDGSVRIIFEDRAVPSTYNFTYNNTSDAEAEEILDYLMTEFAGLTGFKNPKGYSCVEKNFLGEDDRSYYIYDSADDIREDILNHDLEYASFSPDESGKLYCIWIINAYCSSTYVGDYPIITADEATEKLKAGDYYSSIPDDKYFKNGELSSEDIAKVQLEYRIAGEKYYVPYYEVFVELDSEKDEEFYEIPDGAKLYGLFYVPAVNDEHLELLENETMASQ